MSFPCPAIGKQGPIGSRFLAALVASIAACTVAAPKSASGRDSVVRRVRAGVAGEPDASPRGRSAHPRPAKGMFLVASPHIQDPNFAEAVILIVGYDHEGSMGLVLNRRTQVDLATALPDVEELRGIKENLFLGGPVARDRVVLLLRSSKQPEASLAVMEDVFITTSADVLRRVVSKDRSAETFHVYAGYAGWAPGQLDDEVARGDWRVVRGDRRVLFDTPPSEMWPRMMEKLKGEWADRGDSPTLVQRIRTDRELQLVEHVGPDQPKPGHWTDHHVEAGQLSVADL
jgi:putative transcriptional regulator